MSKTEKETTFLVGLVSYDDTAESRRLRANVAQAQQDERCVRKALRLPVLLVLVAVVALGYCGVFLSQRVPYNASILSWRGRLFITNGFLGLGLGSLFSVLVLVVLAAIYHHRADKRRAECRRFAAKLLETRLGKPVTLPLSGILTGHEAFLNLLNRTAAVVPAPDPVSPPEPLMEACGSSDLLKQEETGGSM